MAPGMNNVEVPKIQSPWKQLHDDHKENIGLGRGQLHVDGDLEGKGAWSLGHLSHQMQHRYQGSTEPHG